MSAADTKVRELSAQDRQKLDELLGEFHRTWAPGRLDATLADLPADLPYRLAAVTGLAAVDLEMQWQAGNRVPVEDYLEKYPELGTAENVSIELVLAEFLSRERAESAPPDMTLFLGRFPQQADELRRLILLARSPRLSGSRTRPPGGSSIHAQAGEDGPELPEQFDRYRIQKKLGRGGMGTVYLAYDTRLDRKVALKVPRFAPGSNPENLERFYREARATATITHPNLCPLYDVGEVNGTPYLTMAYIEGWPLAKFIRPDKLLPQFGVATVARIVAQAIEEAHKHGVIHRDLKPGNIMINKRGEPIVMDFGLARWINADKEDVRLTRSGAILGAPVYMSPEQVYGDVNAMGPGCDVYSLGVILYELLTGRLPFEGPTSAVLAKTLIQPPKPPSAHRPDVDPRLEAICLKAMAKKIGDRYQTMGELADALTEYIRAERHAQTLTSLSATEAGDGERSSSTNVGASKSGPPSGGAPSSKSGKRRREALTTTVSVSAGGTKPDLGDPTEVLDAAGEGIASPPDVRLTRPAGPRLVLWLALAGTGMLAVLLCAGVLGWALWSRAPAPAQPPGPAAGEGTLRIALSETPDDVEVRLNGDPIARDRLGEPLRLAPGEYRVEVQAGKFEPWSRTVRVGGGSNPPLEVTLRPKEVVEVKPPEPTPGVLQGHGGAVKSVAWSGDGRYLLSGGEDFSVRLWDVGTRELKQRFDGHRKPVTGVALSADGARALSGDADGTVILWDVRAGKELRRLPGHTDWVRAVAISRDGRRGLSAGDDATVRLWDLDRGEALKVFTGHAGKVWCVALSRDGKRAASGGEDRTVRLWDLERRVQAQEFTGHTGEVRCVTFLADGRVLSGGDDRTLRLWGPGRATELRRFVGHAGKVRGVAVSSDGRRAVSVAFGDSENHDNTVRVWDVGRGKLLYGLGAAPQGNNAVALSANDRWVATGGDDALVHVWDSLKASAEPMPTPAAGERVLELRRFGAPGHKMDRVAVSPDGRFALSAGYDGMVRYWDLAQGAELRAIPAHKGAVRYVTFSPDGKQALSCGEDKLACLWDLGTGNLVRKFEGHKDSVWCAIFSPDGKHVFTSGHNGDPTARLWDADTGAQVREYKGHAKAINALAVSPDGKRLLTAGWDATLRVWDVNSAKELHAFKAQAVNFSTVAFFPDGRRAVAGVGSKVKLYDVIDFKELRTFDDAHKEGVWFVAVSPGGRRVVSSGQDKYVCLWDAGGGKLLHKYTGHADAVPGLAFTPDGTRFLSGSFDTTLRLWDLPRNQYDPPPLPPNRETKEARLLQRPAKPDVYVEQVTFTPDGKKALWSGNDKMVHVWDLAAGREVARFAAHTDGVRSFALLPDGKRVLSAGYDRTLRLWELDNGREVRRFTGPAQRVEVVAVTSDGKRAVSGGDDKVLSLWDVNTAKELKKLVGHDQSVFALALTPDDREAISGGMDQTIRRWDLETGQEIARWAAPGNVHTVAVSPDGRRVLSGGRDAAVNLWDRESGELLASFLGHTNIVTCVRFSPDGRWALSSSDDKTVRLWNIATGQEVARYVASAAVTKGVAFAPDGRQALACSADASVRLLALPEYIAPVPVGSLRTYEAPDKLDRVAVSPDGRLALSAGYDKMVRLWDVESGAEQKSYDWHTGAVHYVSFSPDGRRAASASEDRTAVVWDVESGNVVRRLGHNAAVWGAVFSPDGKRLLTCCEDGTAVVWDVATGDAVQTFRGHAKRVNAAAWAPEGMRVVTASLDGTAKLWDVAGGKELKHYQGHTDGVATVAVSPNGRWIATGSSDKTVRLWDLESEKCLHIFEGHTNQIWNVAFSPDGRRLLSSGGDTTVKLWDVTGRQLLWNYTDHKEGVTGVAFHPDGRRAISSSLDKTLRLWGLPAQ